MFLCVVDAAVRAHREEAWTVAVVKSVAPARNALPRRCALAPVASRLAREAARRRAPAVVLCHRARQWVLAFPWVVAAPRATVVASVLNSPELRAMWEAELGEMRDRIRSMRLAMVEQLTALGAKRDFGFVAQQRGMFSYSGLTVEQVERLKEEFGIYAVGTGRICVAALNNGNLDSVTRAIHAVL